MNKKGLMGIGAFLALAIGIIVCMVLFQQSASDIADATDQFTSANQSIIAPAAGASVDLIGQEIFTTPTVVNSSNSSTTISAGNNYTIAEGISTVSGLKRVRYTSLTGSPYIGQRVNITGYTYGGEGYIDDAGGRAITDLILILAALAVISVIAFKILDDNSEVFG